MTSSTPAPAHQDPSPQESGRVSIMEHVTTVIASLDRRFDSLHQDFKESVDKRFRDADLRYQQRYDAQQIALKDALTSQERAVAKAETAAEKRFDSVNEFRGQLADQAASFMPRSEAEAQYRSIAEKIDDLKAYQAASMGRESVVPGTGKQIQDLVAQVQALRDYRETARGSNLEARFDQLAAQLDSTSRASTLREGKGSGLQAGWGYLIAGVGLIVVVVNVFIAVINN